MRDDRAPETLTVRELKSRLTDAGFHEQVYELGGAPKKDALVALYKQYVTPSKSAETVPRQATRTEERKAGIQHMYDSPAPRASPFNASPKTAGSAASKFRESTPKRSPSVTGDNMFQRSVASRRQSRSRSASQAPAPQAPGEDDSDDGEMDERQTRVGALVGCPWWVILVVAAAALLGVGVMLRQVHPCQGQHDIQVPYGRCWDGALVCDAGAYEEAGACLPDMSYDEKIVQAGQWLKDVLAQQRGQYECGTTDTVGIDAGQLAADVGATFRIMDGRKRFFDDVVSHVNAQCHGCIKRGSVVFVEAPLSRKSLACRANEALRYVIWICLGVMLTAAILYAASHHQARQRQREADMEELVVRLRNGAQASLVGGGVGMLVVDYVKEEWRDMYSAGMVDEAVEILRNDPRVRIKKKLVHGVERRVIEWLDPKINTPSRPSTPKAQAAPSTPSLYPAL